MHAPGTRTRVRYLEPGEYIDASELSRKYPEYALPLQHGVVNHVTPSDDGSGRVFLRSAAFSGDVDTDDEVTIIDVRFG